MTGLVIAMAALVALLALLEWRSWKRATPRMLEHHWEVNGSRGSGRAVTGGHDVDSRHD